MAATHRNRTYRRPDGMKEQPHVVDVLQPYRLPFVLALYLWIFKDVPSPPGLITSMRTRLTAVDAP
jgi:hypothetical protein